MNFSNSSATVSAQGSDVRVSAIIIMTIFETFNVFAVIGNILILLVISRIPEESIGNSTKVCYMGQAATDLCAALVYMLGPAAEAVVRWTGWTYGRVTFCRTVGFIASACPGVSILFVVFLNVDRYLLIVKPFVHRRKATKRRTITASVIVTTLNVLMLLLFVVFCKKSFRIISYHEEMIMCIIDFGDPTFLPFTIPMFSISWMTVVHLGVQYVHIIIISLSRKRKNNRSRRMLQMRLTKKSQGSNTQETWSTHSAIHANNTEYGKDGTTRVVNTNADCSFDRIRTNIPLHKRKMAPTANTNRDTTSVFEMGTQRRDFPRGEPSTSDGISQTPQTPLHHERSDRDDDISHISGNSIVNSQPMNDNQIKVLERSVYAHDHQSVARSVSRRGSKQHVINENMSLLKNNLRILRTPVIITGLFFVTFIPSTFIFMYQAVNNDRIDPAVHAVFTVIVGLNGSLNILVYYWTIKSFKITLKKLLTRSCSR